MKSWRKWNMATAIEASDKTQHYSILEMCNKATTPQTSTNVAISIKNAVLAICRLINNTMNTLGARDFSLFQSIQTGSAAHPASWGNEHQGLFPPGVGGLKQPRNEAAFSPTPLFHPVVLLMSDTHNPDIHALVMSVAWYPWCQRPLTLSSSDLAYYSGL